MVTPGFDHDDNNHYKHDNYHNYVNDQNYANGWTWLRTPLKTNKNQNSPTRFFLGMKFWEYTN